jgi:hypothetical protein
MTSPRQKCWGIGCGARWAVTRHDFDFVNFQVYKIKDTGSREASFLRRFVGVVPCLLGCIRHVNNLDGLGSPLSLDRKHLVSP